MISSIGKYLALALLLLGITTFITTDAASTPATAGEIREFKLWVQYAKAAYYDVTDWKCEVCNGDTTGTRLIKQFKISPERDNGYVAMNDKEKAIIVAYRGTDDPETLEELILNSFPASYPLIQFSWVVDAFLDIYQKTSSEIISLIGDLVKQNPSYKVISTGHSLGGSLATLTSLELIINQAPGLNSSNLLPILLGNHVMEMWFLLTLFGIPLFKFFRLVDRQDLIPYLPPALYNQYPPEYFINTKMEMVICENIFDSDCSISLTSKDLIAHLAYFKDLASM